MTYAKNNRAAPIAIRFALPTGAFGCVRAADTVFAVNVEWPGSESRDANEALDRTISGLGSRQQSYETTSTTVDGQPAELLVAHTAMPEREVFFDYEGRIWEIFIYSESSQADQAKLDFQRIIDTFRILP